MANNKSKKGIGEVDFTGLKNKYKMVVRAHPKTKIPINTTEHDQLRTAQSGTVYKYSENRQE